MPMARCRETSSTANTQSRSGLMLPLWCMFLAVLIQIRLSCGCPATCPDPLHGVNWSNIPFCVCSIEGVNAPADVIFDIDFHGATLLLYSKALMLAAPVTVRNVTLKPANGRPVNFLLQGRVSPLFLESVVFMGTPDSGAAANFNTVVTSATLDHCTFTLFTNTDGGKFFLLFKKKSRQVLSPLPPPLLILSVVLSTAGAGLTVTCSFEINTNKTHLHCPFSLPSVHISDGCLSSCDACFDVQVSHTVRSPMHSSAKSTAHP